MTPKAEPRDAAAAGDATGAQPKRRAAQYVRMSTEHQQYSTENQSDVIREFAAKRGFEIIRTYADEGKSGLNIGGRRGLKQLLADVESGETDFEVVLVYDVSRWGRFQDADESAYYEYICKRAGITVEYCAEQFSNDGSTGSTIIKAVKRTMAGEYSRELSAKVFKGQCKLIEYGFRQGGSAGYGLRRMLVDAQGTHLRILERGEQKSLQTERVVLVPGPEEEIETVRWIFGAFVEDLMEERDIADALNAKGITTDMGVPWTRGVVHSILTNEKYIGNNVYNRRSFKLKKVRVVNPPEMWIRRDGAFEAIIEPALFYKAQGIILEKHKRYSDEKMLEKLRELYSRQGKLSAIIIDESFDTPSASAYRSRFGSLIRAYKLVGYEPDIDYSFIEINRRLRAMHPDLNAFMVAEMERSGAAIARGEDVTVPIRVNGELSVALVLSRCQTTPAGSLRWTVRLEQGTAPDLYVVARLDEDNEEVLDYYVLPRLDMTFEKLRMAEENGVYLDVYRFDDLSILGELGARVPLPAAA